MRSCAFAFLTRGALATRIGPMRVVMGICPKCVDETYIGEYTTVDFDGNVNVRNSKCRECYA